MWFGIRTSNGRKWRKSTPLADNKHCYVVVVVFLWVSENGISAILTGFWWYKFEKWGEKFSNIHFKTVIFGHQKSEDLNLDELGIRNDTRHYHWLHTPTSNTLCYVIITNGSISVGSRPFQSEIHLLLTDWNSCTAEWADTVLILTSYQ